MRRTINSMSKDKPKPNEEIINKDKIPITSPWPLISNMKLRNISKKAIIIAIPKIGKAIFN